MPAENSYPPITSVKSPNVGTKQAAFYLGREQTTLRIWACQGRGPIKPRNIGGRLAWNVAKLRELVAPAV